MFLCAQKDLSICRELIWGFEGKTSLVMFEEFVVHYRGLRFIASRQDTLSFPVDGFYFVYICSPRSPTLTDWKIVSVLHLCVRYVAFKTHWPWPFGRGAAVISRVRDIELKILGGT